MVMWVNVLGRFVPTAMANGKLYLCDRNGLQQATLTMMAIASKVHGEFKFSKLFTYMLTNTTVSFYDHAPSLILTNYICDRVVEFINIIY